MMDIVITFVVLFFIVIPVSCIVDDFITKKLDEFIDKYKEQNNSSFDEDKRS